MWRVIALVPQCMKFARQLIEIKSDSVRLVGDRRAFDDAGVERNFAHERKLSRVGERLERAAGQELCPRGRLAGQVRDHLTGVAEHRMPPCVRVLDVEYRVIARMLD